jgi:hypothetical protein
LGGVTDDRECKLIGEAIAALDLRDIVLWAARYSRPFSESETSDPAAQPSNFLQQTKRQVRLLTDEVQENEQKKTLLRVIVELGLRLADSRDGNDNVYLEIEADYLAEYEVKSPVSDEALAAFAEHNAVHNVWSFWRQHVFDILQRGRLPVIAIPLFAGKRGAVKSLTKAE